jgi:enamine deaminase RidA (YjgF/YER057c/UK114 family)
MRVNLQTRSVKSPAATEIYISAVPCEPAPTQQLAREIFSRSREILLYQNARILQERVFAAPPAAEIIPSIRSETYGELDDGVAPSILLCSEAISGPIAGVQFHAVAADTAPQPIDIQGTLSGRIIHLPDHTYLTLSNVSAPTFPGPTEQAKAMLEKAEAALKQFDTDFLSVPRTWMWLGNILSWYGDFNKVRNDFFTERGIIGKGSRQSAPASTGIGLAPAGRTKCSMDLTAVLEPADSIKYLPAVGKQGCALEYGSAFSRASRAITPAGQTVFVSGTASIDANGETTNIGDALGQINTTIDNVRAVLRDMQCTDEDVVQVVAYCKTTHVEKAFNTVKDRLDWPWLTVICDICRPDLLFEIEAAAMPRN